MGKLEGAGMDIRCIQNIYKSANGVTNISYYILSPVGVGLRGVIQISHGVCEYFSRYTAFAKYLCGLGFIVCGNDHLGHGNSAPKSFDIGFFSNKNGDEALIADVKALTDIMKARYEHLPYFILGHGMGSLIARLLVSRYPGLFDGCIVSGTSSAHPANAVMLRVSNSIVHTKGSTCRSPLLQKMFFGSLLRKIPSPETPFDWLSTDRDVVSLFQSDEKCNFLLTASAFRDLNLLIFSANSIRCIRATEKNFPMLFISGDMDPFGEYGEGVKKTAALYKKTGGAAVDLVLYKGLRHEILNETNKLEVYGDIIRWIEHVLTRRAEEPLHPEDADLPDQLKFQL